MKLDTWIKKKNMTYQKMANEIGVDKTTMFRYAKGERTPRLAIALKIEKYTKGKVKCSDLIGE